VRDRLRRSHQVSADLFGLLSDSCAGVMVSGGVEVRPHRIQAAGGALTYVRGQDDGRASQATAITDALLTQCLHSPIPVTLCEAKSLGDVETVARLGRRLACALSFLPHPLTVWLAQAIGSFWSPLETRSTSMEVGRRCLSLCAVSLCTGCSSCSVRITVAQKSRAQLDPSRGARHHPRRPDTRVLEGSATLEHC
jgi:hypothetical protein